MLRNSIRRLQPLLAKNYTTNSEKTTIPKESQKKAKVTGAKSSASNESYQAPEYYNHNINTYADYEVAMAKSRLPQPSNKSK